MVLTGIDIGGTKCAVSLGNEQGDVLKKICFRTLDVTNTLIKIREAVKEMGDCDAIGISCGGPLDSEKGIIISPPNLIGWDHIPIVEILEKEFHVPVFLRNDADACALAEWKFGAGKGADNIIFLTFGTGMGAGLILNGQLYSGANNMAGEIGHVRMSQNGPVGYGKEGSFEGFCSGNGIAQLGMSVAREMFQRGEKVSFCEHLENINDITAKEIADRAGEGKQDAVSVYCKCGHVLGRGLAILIDVLNPDRIILGSVYTRSGELLKEEMYKALKQECLARSLEKCEILPATLGENLGDVAAISVAVDGMKNFQARA